MGITRSKSNVTVVVDEVAPELDVETLGRQRPEVFSSTWMEVAFVGSMLISLAMGDFFLGGFQVVLPGLLGPLNIPETSQTWPSSVLTLVAGSLLFPCGRLADMYGGYVVFHGGMIWFVFWTVITGFSKNFIMLVMCRALQGLGAAMFLPSGISLLGCIYRPGPRKNLVFSLYGALGPLGFFLGIIIGGMAQDELTWRWYFWLGSILAAVCCVGSLLTCPRDYTEARKRGVTMDWWGLCTTVPALVLIIYAVTDSREAPEGWASPQIIVTLIAGILLLAAAVYVEGWRASAPLVPPEIFHIKHLKSLLLTLFLTWGAFAIFLFYANFYIQTVLGKPALLTATWFGPWAGGGLVLAICSGLILHILPGRVLLVFSAVCKVIAVLLFALIPDEPNYWAWVFPAMLAEAACVDVLWTVSNVYLTTCLPRRLQGLAGALINITLFLGTAFFLAIAAAIIGKFKSMGWDLKHQYKGIFWVGVGFAAVAMVLCFFMDLEKAGCSRTVDEKVINEPISSSETDFATASTPETITYETPRDTNRPKAEE